jgi:hypothetical protein
MCLYARFQASPQFSHRTAVKQIFRYFKHTPEFKIWYSTSSLLDLVGFFAANFAGVGLTERALLVLVIFSNLLFYIG